MFRDMVIESLLGNIRSCHQNVLDICWSQKF